MADVPDVEGVPALADRDFFEGVIDLGLMTFDLVSLPFGAGPQWGVFQGGEAIVVPDTIASFDYKQNWSVSDYPLEKGAFESYDKVQSAFEVRVVLTTGGSLSNRTRFIAEVDAIAGTLDLYDVVTPERIYPNVNVTGQSYRRVSGGGAGMVAVDLMLREVRINAEAQFSNTKNPAAADPVDQGTVTGKSITITTKNNPPA